MNILLMFPILFVLGSLFGFFVELFYKYAIDKKISNSGFLIGPYIPIYGVGLIMLYLISYIDFNNYNFFLRVLLLSIISTFIVTILEYLTGLMFYKTLKIRLWDYSNKRGNIQGFICPLYSFYWFIISFIYYSLLDNYIKKLLFFIIDNQYVLLSVGIFIGVMAIDFVYSTSIAFTVRELAKERTIIINYYPFKKSGNKKTILSKMNE